MHLASHLEKDRERQAKGIGDSIAGAGVKSAVRAPGDKVRRKAR